MQICFFFLVTIKRVTLKQHALSGQNWFNWLANALSELSTTHSPLSLYLSRFPSLFSCLSISNKLLFLSCISRNNYAYLQMLIAFGGVGAQTLFDMRSTATPIWLPYAPSNKLPINNINDSRSLSLRRHFEMLMKLAFKANAGKCCWKCKAEKSSKKKKSR